jgi:hypothetical protein
MIDGMTMIKPATISMAPIIMTVDPRFIWGLSLMRKGAFSNCMSAK